MDANFRLARRNVSNDTVDPGLSHGWSYFVEDTKYRQHLKENDDLPQEVRFSYVQFIYSLAICSRVTVRVIPQ